MHHATFYESHDEPCDKQHDETCDKPHDEPQ